MAQDHRSIGSLPAPSGSGEASPKKVVRGNLTAVQPAEEQMKGINNTCPCSDELPRTQVQTEVSLEPPVRQYECENYNTCLGLAAALDWISFSCSGCSGKVNNRLLWRAHHEVRKNTELATLCELPKLSLTQREAGEAFSPDSDGPFTHKK